MGTRFFTVFLSVVLSLSAFAAASPVGAQEGVVPYWPGESWRTSTPEEQGMDSAELLAALDFVASEQIPMDSITVIRHGYVVLDAYYHPYTADTRHHLWAATESFIATLVGIAADQGLITGMNQPLLALFPDRVVANRTERKEALRVGELLMMTSGIACDATDMMNAFLQASDPLGFLLDLEVQFVPGDFNHCSLNSDLLAGVVETVAGMPLLDYADNYLFGPLGISDYEWQMLPGGMPFGQLGLHLTPHDMARLGYLYLNGGQWAGEQVLSPTWIDTVTCADPAQCPYFSDVASWSVLARGQMGYGYHWWMYPSFYASGVLGSLGGQVIAVAPGQDLVVVLTSRSKTTYQDIGAIPFGLIHDRILGSVRSDAPLPANPDALVALEARVALLAHPHAQEVPDTPAMAAQVNGVTYDLASPAQLWAAWRELGEYLYGGSLLINAFTLSFTEDDKATLTLEFADGYTVALPMGLDGVNRVTDTRIGPLALTGVWAPTGRGFAMNLEFVGEGEERQLTFGTLGKNVLLICQDVSTGITQPPAAAVPRE